MAIIHRLQKNVSLLSFWLGFFVFVACLVYLADALFFHPKPYLKFNVFFEKDIYAIFGLLFLMLIFSLANILIESYKWYSMVRLTTHTDFKTAVKSVLQGLALGFITPNRVGDYPGRTLVYKKSERGNLILLNLFSGYAQFIVICLLGLSSWMFLKDGLSIHFQLNSLSYWMAFMTLSLLFVGHILLLFYTKSLTRFLKRIRLLKVVTNYFSTHSGYSFQQVSYFVSLSLLRTIVYSIQLFILLYYFDRSVDPFTLLNYINIYFLLLTLSPSFFLNKIGIRESLALFVFGAVINNPVTIVVCTMGLWIINQVIPATIGSLTLLKSKKQE